MPSEPSVSVIIPTYNRAAFLAAAVRSVLDQTLPNVETIVVDDGSTDATQAVLQPFGGAIRVIATENKGVSHARNIGMKAARGRYIAFLDDDDRYLPHKLGLQVSFMEAHPEVGLVSTEVSSLVGEDIQEERHLRTFHGTWDRLGWSYEDVYPTRGLFPCAGMTSPVPFYIGQVFRCVLHGTLIMSNTVLFRRSLLEQAGYQNESYRLAEDYEWLVRACKLEAAAFLDVPTYLYRYHGDQITKLTDRGTPARIAAQIEIETTVIRTILDCGYHDAGFRAGDRGWLDRVLAGKYQYVGEKWLECGEPAQARRSFRLGVAHERAAGPNRVLWLLTFFPAFLRRVLLAIAWRVNR